MMGLSDKRPSFRKRRLLPQERALLTLLQEQRALRLDLLPRYLALFGGKAGHLRKSTAYNLVERLLRRRLIHAQQLGKHTPAWIWLSTAGVRAVGSQIQAKAPSRTLLPVLHASNLLRLLLTEQDPHVRWISLCAQTDDVLPMGSPLAELRTKEGQRIVLHVLRQTDGLDEQMAVWLQGQLESETSAGTASTHWYYAPLAVAQRLRAVRAILAETDARAKRLGIFSYPPLYERVLLHQAPVRTLSWSPDGTCLASVTSEAFSVWQMTGGRSKPLSCSIQAEITCLLWSGDGTWLLLGGSQGKLLMWERATGRLFALTAEHHEKITSLALLPHDVLVSCSASGRLTLLDLHRRIWLAEVRLPHAAEEVAWSPDGSALAVVGPDASVHLYASQGGTLLSSFQPAGPAITALSWSPDGTLLACATADGRIHLWEAKAGGSRETIDSGVSSILHLAFAPSGTLLACASTSLIQIWQVPTRQRLSTTSEHADAIMALSWSPSGSHLASASNDGTILLYPTPTENQTIISSHPVAIHP